MIVALFVIFVEAVGIEMFGDLVEIVLSSLWKVDIGIFLVVLLLFGLRIIAVLCIFFLLFCFLFFVFVSGWWLCFLKEEFMFVISGFYFFVQLLRPVMVVINVLSQLHIFVREAVFAGNFDIFFVLIDDGVGEEIVGGEILGILDILYLFIAYEFGVVLLVLLEILGVVALDWSYFLYCVYFAELVYVLESCLITHF